MNRLKSLSDPDILKFSKMEQYISEEYWRNISVNEIASAGGVCRSKCFSLFSTFSKKTPNEYLNDFRLKMSKELLSGTMSPLSVICQECGFSSQSYFCTTFQKKFGMTPSAYRKENFNASKATEERSEEFQKNMYEAITALSFYFYKILKINLTDDSYSIIKPDYTDRPETSNARMNLSAWLKEFESSIHLHEDDKQNFSSRANLNYLRRFFDSQDDAMNKCLRFRYRRMVNDEFKWVLMEVIPCPDYSKENKNVFMYIRDIDNELMEVMNENKKTEPQEKTDALTGLKNLSSFEDLLDSLESNSNTSEPAGIIYCDLNGLKFVNDNYGHDRGDKMLMDFTTLLTSCFRSKSCYRIGGDEFIVAITGISADSFLTRLENLKRLCQKSDKISASIGSAWTDDKCNIRNTLKRAELQMYEEKKNCHSQMQHKILRR